MSVSVTYLVLFVIDESLHMHISDISVVGKVVRERTVMCCEERQGQRMGS